MTFLVKETASKHFHFAEVYSCLQKSIRRNDINICLELVKEFNEYPNALKKRLIYVVVEDLPDYRLMQEIYTTKSTIEDLVKWIPIVCNHVKSRAGTTGFRYAVECPDDDSEFTDNDTLKEMLVKLAHGIKNGKQKDMIDWFEDWLEKHEYHDYKRNTKIQTIYNFIGKARTVLTGMCVFVSTPEVRTYNKDDIDNVILNNNELIYGSNKYKFEKDKYTLTRLPQYTYDKHVAGGDKSYKFFFNNLVLSPRLPPPKIEIYGEYRYIESNEGAALALFTDTYSSHSTIYKYEQMKKKFPKYEDPEVVGTLEQTLINELKKMDKYQPPSDNVLELGPYKVIQTQLITSRYKPKTYFASLDGINYKYIVKGPYTDDEIIRRTLLSDELKKYFGLVSCNAEEISINGFRYIRFDNLIKIDKTKVIRKSSALEVDVDIYCGNKHFIEYSEVNVDVLLILAFRKIIETNDTCPRNILKLNNDSYASIDDISFCKTTHPTMFKKPLLRSYAAMYEDCLRDNWKLIEKRLRQWKRDIKGYNERIYHNVCVYLDMNNWTF